jgi:hypothetical protein
LTEDAVLTCDHLLGKLDIDPRQRWVTVEGRALLVRPDPEDRPIHHCPNIGATIKPCGRTFRVLSGYSPLVRIDDHPLCLDDLYGLTNGTPPESVRYGVRVPGQELVTEEGAS